MDNTRTDECWYDPQLRKFYRKIIEEKDTPTAAGTNCHQREHLLQTFTTPEFKKTRLFIKERLRGFKEQKTVQEAHLAPMRELKEHPKYKKFLELHEKLQKLGQDADLRKNVEDMKERQQMMARIAYFDENIKELEYQYGVFNNAWEESKSHPDSGTQEEESAEKNVEAAL